MSLRQRLVPYWTPGTGPALADRLLRRAHVLHGRTGAALGLADHRLHLRLGLVELPRLALRPHRADRPLLLLRRHGDAARPADRLPAGLRDRLPRRPLQAAAALRRDRALLHHLPDPHDRLEDDPQRLQPDRQRPADAGAGAAGRARARHLRRGDRRAHLQLPALHDPAALRQPGAARPAPGRGGQGPLLLLAPGLPAGDPATDHAGDRRRRPAHLHPRLRRLHQRPAARRHPAGDGRQRDPVALPQPARLPGGGGALLPDDGADPRHRHRLHPLRRHRRLHGRRGGGEADGRRRARLGLAAAQRAADLRRARRRLHADPDRRHRRLLLRRDAQGQTHLRPRQRLHHRVLDAAPSRCRSSTTRSSPACAWRRSRPRSRPRSAR